ncbi:MAG: hypothetical protein AAGJ52_02275 [Pseudomonadota bacterium]
MSTVSASANQVDVGDTSVGVTTTYDVSYKLPQNMDSTTSLFVNSNGGANLSSAALNGVTGGNSLNILVTSQTATSVNMTVLGGTASAGEVITLEFAGVVNPGTVGLGPDYTIGQIDTDSNPPIPVFVTLPGTVYTGDSSQPVVVAPIADLTGGQALFEDGAATEASSDLNTVFEDADMDPLNFSLDPGTDPAIATAEVTMDDRVLVTPVGSGLTTVNVRATAVDGSVVDSFDVRVVGDIDDAIMTPGSLDVGETTSYVLTFTTPGALSAGQNIVVNSGPSGPDYSSASLTFSGGSLSASLPIPGSEAFRVSLNSGTAAAGTPITITLNNVVNPGNAGLGPDYVIRTTDSALLENFDLGTAPGNVFEAGGAPFVVNPITDQSLNEVDGAATVVADISTVFDEDDGDPVTYAVLPGNDPLIATAELVNNSLIVTPTGPGSTTITVEASDVDGAISDSFDVAVVGLMDNATFGPANNATSALTNYDFSFTPSTALNDSFVIIVRNIAVQGPDYSGAQLLNFSGGTLNLALSGGNSTQVAIEITGGTASIGETVSFTLSSVINPTFDGTGPDYQSELLQIAGATIVETATISGSEYVAPVDEVFEDRFETPSP